MSRPSQSAPDPLDDPTVIHEILRRVTECESVNKTVESYGVSRGRFYARLAEDAVLADRYARAKIAACESMANEIIEIADAASAHDGDGEHVQRSRLRVDTRKWLLSKIIPKLYGERVDITGGPLLIVRDMTGKGEGDALDSEKQAA